MPEQGLLQGAKEGPPSDEPMANAPAAEMATPEEETVEGNVSPEEQAVYDEAVNECVRAVTEEQKFKKFLARVSKGVRDPVDLIGEEAAGAGHLFDGASDESLPRDMIVHIIVDVASALADALQEAQIIPSDQETDQQVIAAAIHHAGKVYGEEVPPELAQQAGAPPGGPAPQSQPPPQGEPPMQGAM